MWSEVLIVKCNPIEQIKEKINKQNNLKIEFKKKLEDIKQKYGIDFDIELLDNNSVDKIKFYNLKYKNKARDMSLVYYCEFNYYGAYIYTINKDSSIEEENYITRKNYLNKEYKLDLIIEEIRQANEIYKSKLLELEENYREELTNNLELENKRKKNNN